MFLCFADLFLRGQLYNSVLPYQHVGIYNIQLERTNAAANTSLFAIQLCFADLFLRDQLYNSVLPSFIFAFFFACVTLSYHSTQSTTQRVDRVVQQSFFYCIESAISVI